MHLGTGFEQPAHVLTASGRRCEIQRCPPTGTTRVNGRSGPNQLLESHRAPQVRRQTQGRVAIIVACLNVRSVPNQQTHRHSALDRRRVSAVRGVDQVKRRVPILRFPLIHVEPVRQEEAQYLSEGPVCGEVKRGSASLIPHARVGAVIEEKAHHSFIPIPDGPQKRRFATVIPSIDVRTTLQHQYCKLGPV
jgi:hypothetical protein